MEKDFNETKLSAFLNGLAQEERAWLLRELLADYWQQSQPYPQEEILAAERWFMNRVNQANAPAHRLSRKKILVIFLLLRYGGLRWSEICALAEKDLDLENGLIRICGDFARIVPLPLPVCARLMPLRQSGVMRGPNPLYTDASQLRRILRICASELGLNRASLTLRSLRSLRAFELQKSGIHPQLVRHFFNGPANENSYFSDPDLVLRKQIQKEIKMENLLKTSARNTFRGKVLSLNHRGLLVDVVVETTDGLKVTSTITDTSCKSLALEVGKPVNAIVKAPWVKVVPVSHLKKGGETNSYEGVVEDMRSDANATEVLIKLAQGTQLCAIAPKPETVDPSISKGGEVGVEISDFAVILIAG